MTNSLPELYMYRPGSGGSGSGSLICARKWLWEKDARDSSRISDIHGYWVCSAYHLPGAALRLPAQAIGQKLGRFPCDFLNENHRHSLHCGVVGPQGSTTDSRIVPNTHWCHHLVTVLGVDTNRRWRRLGAKLSWTVGRCFCFKRYGKFHERGAIEV